MKRFLKIIGAILGILVLLILLFLWNTSEKLPQGKSGSDADALAHKMLKALNQEAYESTRYLEWTFRGKNQYRWDKAMGICHVKWDDVKVVLHLTDPDRSVVTKSNQPMSSEDTKKAVDKALASFNNDSFWLVAPYKVFDEGVQRKIVDLEDGTQALLITYTSGGTTPGDSYLWLLNANGFPNAYKMWVDIIPVGGVEATWDDWMVSESGAFLPKSHKLGPMTLDMGAVKGYNH